MYISVQIYNQGRLSIESVWRKWKVRKKERRLVVKNR